MRACHCKALASPVLHLGTTSHMMPTTKPLPSVSAAGKHPTMAAARLVMQYRVLIITGSRVYIPDFGKILEITLPSHLNDNLM